MTKSMTDLSQNSKNIFYFHTINRIGGVESFLWYLANLYNIEVYYREGNIEQIQRLATKIPVHKYNGEHIVCEKAFFNYTPDIIDNIEAKEYICVIHCDYKQMWFSPNVHKKYTKYIGVSQLVCDSFYELTGIKPELVYNPVVIDKKAKKPLIIVAATRLTREKGKDNLIMFANKLSKANIPYLLIVFTDDKDRKHEINNPNIIYAEPQLNIAPYLQLADWVLIPSNTEAFGYTIVESLMLSKPVIAMNLPVYKELGIKDGVHGYIVDDMNTFDVEKILKKPPKFEYEPPKSNWGEYLNNKSTYDPNKKVKVKVLADYDDMVLNKHLITGEEKEMTISRAYYLVEKRLIKIL